MMWKYPHAAVLKRFVRCIGKPLRPKFSHDAGVDKDIDSAGHPHLGETFAADARGLTLIDECDSCMFDGIADRCCLSVVQSRERRTDDEFLEMPETCFTKMNDVDNAGFDKVLQSISVSAATRPTSFEFIQDEIDNNDFVRQR